MSKANRIKEIHSHPTQFSVLEAGSELKSLNFVNARKLMHIARTMNSKRDATTLSESSLKGLEKRAVANGIELKRQKAMI